MNLLMIPRIALKALAQNKLRTGLTMLGIIIGVGAVICVVAIGEGASASVERAITNIGANMIWVEAGGVNRGGVRTGAFGTKTLTLGDYDAIREHVFLVTKGQSATGQDQDDQFLMPYTTVMKKIKGQIWLDDIMCSAISAAVVDQA